MKFLFMLIISTPLTLCLVDWLKPGKAGAMAVGILSALLVILVFKD